MKVVYDYPIVDLNKNQAVSVYGHSYIYDVIDTDKKMMAMLRDKLIYKSKLHTFLLLEMKDDSIDVITSLKETNEKTILATVVSSIPPPSIEYVSDAVINLRKSTMGSIFLDKNMDMVTTDYRSSDVFNNTSIEYSAHGVTTNITINMIDTSVPICVFDVLLVRKTKSKNRDDEYGFVLGRVDKNDVFHMFSREVIKISFKDAEIFSMQNIPFKHI